MRFGRQLIVTVLSVALFCQVLVASEPRKLPIVFQPIEDNPDLPRVLLLGDSISIGYTLEVRRLLDGKANVHRAPENCGPTTRGLDRLGDWLGEEPWDVIHFNFGLHDLKYVDSEGRRVPPEEGALQVPPPKYEANLRLLVHRLKKTGAKLVWCTTTPVPEGAQGRVADDSRQYNRLAAKVMRQLLGDDRVINDLHAFCEPQLSEIQQTADVHFTKDGSVALAAQVANIIEQQLLPIETELARGLVYVDHNDNHKFDGDDKPMPAVRVSNGREIVLTNDQGRYELPIEKDGTVFVIKPRGYRTAVSEDQLPQFYYTHKPQGSPEQRFPGVAPTGPLPESIDFALYPQEEPEQFKAILFGDPQPRNLKEVDFVAHDVVEELIGTDASFGVTLGDIAFDDLNVFEPQARIIAKLGIPWYNVIGNHDLNFDARNDRESDETFQRVFGPAYYSFDHGPVHFLVLDDVEWLVDENGSGRYQGGFGRRQMEFIRRDLDMIPPNQLVVLLMHIPLTGVRDRLELYRLIEQRPFCMSVSAHTHHHEHRYITHDDGWLGPKPHHHVVNVTVSGSWWSGARDERGIPHTTMADGAPNGYSIISFDGHDYRLRFKAAGRPEDYQMQIHAPNVVQKSTESEVQITANVFNGAEDTKVQLCVNQGVATKMNRVLTIDPFYEQIERDERDQLAKLTQQGESNDKLWVGLPKPKRSTHLWRISIPVAQLEPGVHVLRVTAQLDEEQVVTGRRLIRVEP